MATSAGCGKAAGAGGSVTTSDCDGEDQEEPSSSHSHQDLDEAIGNLNLQDKDSDDELSAFRRQWQRELEATPSPQREPRQCTEPPTNTNKRDETEDESWAFRSQWQKDIEVTQSPQHKPYTEAAEPSTDDERAKFFFLKAVEYERNGKLYEAVQHYKRAIQIQPDIEARLYESSELRTDTPDEELEDVETACALPNADDIDDDVIEGEDLTSRFQRLLAKKGGLFEQEYASSDTHISWLPYEVLLLIMRWVVSSDLDALSLERLAATSRGFYIAAREPDLWRSLCVRTWGIECGTARSLGYQSWRDMYICRPRLQLHGCYISKTTYLRHGENSFQDQFYRPWYLIDYYRYLRFFPEGVVLMWTTADEPSGCVGQLRSRTPRPGLGIMPGHYRLRGDKVVVVVKKSSGNEKKSAQNNNSRFRSRRKNSIDSYEQTFHLELELRAVRSRRNHQLVWVQYSALSRRGQWSHFDLSPGKFPPFAFSRVKTYTAQSNAPLPSTHAYT